jgi:Ca2+-binding RTX toxin-like protein
MGIYNFILTNGNDQIFGIQTAYGLGGDDFITAEFFADGGDGNDNLSAYGTIIGGNGDDFLSGSGGATSFIGGDGVDTANFGWYSTGVTVDLVAGTGGTNDHLTGIENVWGTNSADVLIGDGAANALTGWAGDDVLFGGGGADHLDGGDGIDTADYDPDLSHNTVGVTVDLAAGTASGGNAQGDVLVGIENLAGTAYADTLTGDAGANSLWGRDGNDVLHGGGGDDTLAGGAGGDVMDGGSGTDVASFAAALAGVTLSLGSGLGTGGDALGDSYTGIENVLGSAFADAITGDGGANRIDGDAGNDVLQGGGGADTLIGGAGFDIADYGASPSAVTIDMGSSANSGGDALGDILIGIEAVGGSNFADVLTGDTGANTIWGRAGNDLISGAAGNDTLYGEAGTDTLAGGDGDDVLIGGAGADGLNGGSGIDTVHYASAAAAVRVDLIAGAGAGGEAAGDSFVSIENAVGSAFDDLIIGDGGANRLAGLAGADRLYASGGNDVVDGGDGNDMIVGGGGADILKGGTGADSFTYTGVTDSTVVATGRDAIIDFSHAEGDRIDLSTIDADGNAANGNTAFSFLGGGAFTGAGHELRVAVISGVQVVQVDLTGDKVPDMQINVTSATTLAAGDFVL